MFPPAHRAFIVFLLGLRCGSLQPSCLYFVSCLCWDATVPPAHRAFYRDLLVCGAGHCDPPTCKFVLFIIVGTYLFPPTFIDFLFCGLGPCRPSCLLGDGLLGLPSPIVVVIFCIVHCVMRLVGRAAYVRSLRVFPVFVKWMVGCAPQHN